MATAIALITTSAGSSENLAISIRDATTGLYSSIPGTLDIKGAQVRISGSQTIQENLDAHNLRTSGRIQGGVTNPTGPRYTLSDTDWLINYTKSDDLTLTLTAPGAMENIGRTIIVRTERVDIIVNIVGEGAFDTGDTSVLLPATHKTRFISTGTVWMVSI